jgi:hypothetical protein
MLQTHSHVVVCAASRCACVPMHSRFHPELHEAGQPQGGKERKCERWCVKQSSPSHGVYCVLYLFSSVITTEKMCESSLCWFMNWDHRYMILVEIIYCEGTV